MLRTIAATVITVLAFVCASTAAQSESAAISGRITDRSGSVLSGVRVQILHLEMGVDATMSTNTEGVYVLRGLRPGVYRLTVEKTGFRTIVLEPLSLAAQDVLGRNFTMDVGPVTDAVIVSAGAELQSLSPSVGTVVNRHFVENLPLNGRSFQSLINLTPGSLMTPAGQGMEGQFTVHGQRTNTNVFTVDGVGANFGSTISVNLGQNLGGSLPALTITGGTNGLVSVDAMQEFRTQTSTYAAEFGRMPGAQIAIVTRAGTNEFHGTIFDYIRDRALDARNWFNPFPEPKPALGQHDFGGTIGGPLRASRSFFFFSYEGLRLQQPQTATASFYTPDARAMVAPVYRFIVDAQPSAEGPPVDPACDNSVRPCSVSLTAERRRPTGFDAYSLRIDHRWSDRQSFFVRLSSTPSTALDETFLFRETAKRDTAFVTAGATSVVSPHVVNDLRVGWGRAGGSAAREPVGVAATAAPPSSVFPSGHSPGRTLMAFQLPGAGLSVGTRSANESRQWNVVNTTSVASGNHLLAFGLDYRHLQAETQGSDLYLLIVSTFGQARAGTMGTVGASSTEPNTLGLHNLSVFGQDTWKVTSRLTATYGLRWELNTPPLSILPDRPLRAVEGIFDAGPLQFAPAGAPLWRTRFDNVAPRAGAAYQMNSVTVVRGGVGAVHDLGYGGLLGRLLYAYPYTRTRTVAVTGQPFDFANPAFDPLPIGTEIVPGLQDPVASFDPALQLPVTWQWNATVDRQLGASQSLTVAYVGSTGQRLLRPDLVLVPNAGGLANPRVSATRNAGRSAYDALQVQFQRRLSRGLQALTSYALASARDTESDDLGGNFTGVLMNGNSASSLAEMHLPALAPADFDVRHSFTAAVSYAIPAPSWGEVARALLGNWGVDAVVRSSSAPPLNVRIEGVSPELGAYRTQPDVVPGQPIWLAAPDEPGGKVLNPDAFTLPAAGTPGNFARNSIRSPFNVNQTDVAIRRRFSLGSAASIEFRAEAFNVFDTAMFGGSEAPSTFWGRCTRTPCTGQNNAAFGKVVQTLNDGFGSSPLAGGQSGVYATGGPRSIQLSLKLRY